MDVEGLKVSGSEHNQFNSASESQ